MSRVITLLTVFAMLLTAASAQDDPAPQATPEATPNQTPDLPEIPALQLRSYDSAWTRWRNLDENDNPILHHEGTAQFPFIWVKNAAAIKIADLHDADFLEGLLENHELSYDEDAKTGDCDAEKLAQYDSSDLFCMPGAQLMPQGHIFLALFHPETGELAALTTTIDNNSGGAAKLSAARPEPAPEPAATPMPDSCGPYGDEEWASAEDDLAAHGVEIRGAYAGTTDYKCVVPADGGAPYFQAYTIQRHEKQSGGTANGGQANGAGGDARRASGGGTRRGSNSGYIEPAEEPLPPEPCTHPIMCDGGDGEE